jgi:nucleotide-binding universal stress UspA family protein
MKILVATDGSENSLNAVKYAARLTANLGSSDQLTLVSVHDDTALRHASHLVGRAEVDDYLRDLSEKELQPALQALAGTNVAHDHAIVVGHVSEEIVKLADSGKYDMIVMGSKGRSGIADLLIGSVAQRVLATARQPVLLVK